ncbi:ATP-binding cassette domain-containing protein [Puniceibacterium sediminis]|uniref:Putative ATP-binding cassette transporter n=1 Tax=Puniceibacterium sediminis TaxID=1608407 RepID=A0A238ZBX3_9RHOB|nr:ATP-binding cassette domain-containing protein [Puniceibacterium sediminis]SNR80263.1 putative ATP-binding cassette transporter [Puniceibacterium sediminis]
MTKKASQTAQPHGLGEKLLRLMASGNRTKQKARDFRLVRLWSSIGKPGLVNLGLIAILSATCGTVVLFLLNAEAREVEYHGYSRLMAFGFLLLLIIYRWAQNYLIREATQSIETALHDRRLATAEDVLNLSLEDIQTVGLRNVMDGSDTHYSSLSQTLVPIIAGAEGLVLLLFMFAYLLFLSPLAALLTTVVVVLTVAGFLTSRGMLDDDMRRATKAEEKYREITEGLVRGAKELSLNPARRRDFQTDVQNRSEYLAQGRGNAAAHFAGMLATGNSASYLMAGSVVFIMPLISQDSSADISRIMIAVMFLLGPISAVVQTFQQVTTAQYALSEIDAFQERVAALSARREQDTSTEEAESFQSVELVNLCYRHGGEQGFAITDIDFLLTRNEIVFMTGGNGSGKTTLLRVLTGLYPRRTGDIQLNGAATPLYQQQSYRNLFSTVFADFHVFPEPYGLDEAGLKRFEHWLNELGIRDKFGPDLRTIDPAALSTGQKKRLGLALALAEDRQILILDEWAADQDPETRRRFYREILPGLRDAGKTILAATHDEQYFDCCDRRVHMATGRLNLEVNDEPIQ